MNLGKTILDLRKQKNVTQEDLAAELGVTAAAVSKWENGYTLPDVLTWDFIWEVSEAAMKKDENGIYALNGQEVLIPFIYKSTDNMMIQYLRQAGAGYSTENGGIAIFNDTTREFLFTIADHVKTGAFSTFKISSYPANFLNAGQCRNAFSF